VLENGNVAVPAVPTMSDASPTIFKRKSKPSQRQRDKSPDDTEQPPLAGDSGRDSPITLAAKLKIKAKRAQPKSRLSFGADDEVCISTALYDLILKDVWGNRAVRNKSSD
jgi:hypothetical protein